MIPASPSDGSTSPEPGLRDIAGYLNRGDAAAALERLAPLLTVAQPSLGACFALAMTAWQLERFDWALSVLRQCHEMSPDNGGVAEALASLQAQLGQLEESLYTGKLATALGNDPALAALMPTKYPTFDHAFLSIVEKPLLGKAREAHAQGKLQRAIEMARQHVAIEPHHSEGRAFHAECLLRAGAAGAAVETLRVLANEALPPALASLYARALTAVGERGAALHWHRGASGGAADDAAIAAAHIADAPFLGLSGAEIVAMGRDWAERFALAPKPTRKHAAGKLVVGYLVSAMTDAEDAAAIAAAARAHDRGRVAVLGFGHGTQTAEQNASLVGVFSKWRDISALDPATLARTLAGDGVDVLIDAGGFASAQQLQALSRIENAVRVSWLCNPAGMLAPFYDERLSAADYPVLEGGAAARAESGAISFGADVALAQLEPKIIALWSAILALVPEAKLVLRARDMEAPNIARLIAQFGEEVAARIDIRQAPRAGDFYCAVDVALLPLLGASPRAAAEALAHGRRVVAMAGEPYGAFLSGRGLGGRFVAGDGTQYCSLAVSLARSAEARALPAIETGAGKLACRIEEFAGARVRRENAA